MQSVHDVVDLVFRQYWGIIRELESSSARAIGLDELTDSIGRLKDEIRAGKVTIFQIPSKKQAAFLEGQKDFDLSWRALLNLNCF